MLFLINAVNNTAGNNYFRVIGEHASAFPVGSHVQVRNSTGNDGIYKLSASTNVTGHTHLTAEQAIPSAVVDGTLNGGVYQIDFSDATIAGKEPLVLAPTVIDSTSTSITLPSRGAWDYGERLVENAVHMLENFASNTPPNAPTIGQQWFDYSLSTMKTFVDGSWSTDANIEGGTLSFKDPQNSTPDSKIFVTASEPGGIAATGLTVYPEHDIAVGAPLFRVMSSGGLVHLGVERANAVRTDLRFIADSALTNEFKGKLSVGTPTNSYSTGSSMNIKGHIDVSGKLIIDETAAQHGVYGLVSGSAIRTVAGLWNVTSANSDAALFSNSGGVVARLGTNNTFSTPTIVNSTLNVTGTTTLSTTTIVGTATITDIVATASVTSPLLTVTGSLLVNSTGPQLLKTLDANGLTVTNLAEPTVATDAATKKYVDDNDYLSLMSDVAINSPLDKQVLYYQNGTSKWVNATLDTTYINGFGGNVKDQAADMIDDGTHVGITPTYNSGSKALSLVMDTRPITVDGDIDGSVDVNWAGTTTLTLTLPASGIGAGTYTKVTYAANGLAVAGGTLTVADIPDLPASKITSGTLSVDTSGNAATATKLATARTINGVSFDGTANIVVADATKLPLAGGTVTGVVNFTNATDSTSPTTGALIVTGGIGVTGNVYSAGDVYGYSDARLKTNITRITNALSKVLTLDGVAFDRIDTGVRQAGLLADQVLNVLPEAVSTEGEYLAVAYGNLTGLLVEAIKDLSEELQLVRGRLDQIEGK